MKKFMISIGVGALIFAIWFVTLFVGKSIGLSILLFIVPFSYFFIYILEKNGKIKNKKAKFLLVPIILLSSTYFIFNNVFFNICNLVIIFTLLILMILILLEGRLVINPDLIEKFFGLIITPIDSIGESFKIIKETLYTKKNSYFTGNAEKKKKMKKIFKAFLVALPIIAVVTILLATADEIFANIFETFFYWLNNLFKPLENVDSSIIVVRIILGTILFFYFIGLFYYTCLKYELKNEENIIKEKINDNFTTKIVLISLNIIYLVFCYIQIKSLFLKNTTLRNVTFNYADYARQGFFQLMAVSFINLVTILIAKKRENKDDYKTNSFINYMSIIMIVFTFIIVISAGVRMHFYESTYGYTLLRLLVYCTLFTESILFIPTVLFVLDKKINLIKSYFIIIISVYICMNFMNFDNIIAKRNVDRYFEKDEIDLNYLEIATGTDAVNQIIRIINEPKVSMDVKKEAKEYLIDLYKSLDDYSENKDFRDFNISKIRARKLIRQNY